MTKPTARRKIYVHIGIHKTGTSSIQRVLYALSDQLFIRGYLYPMSARHPREFRSHALLPHLLGVKVPEEGPMRLATQIDEEAVLRSLRNEIDTSGLQNVIISSEDLWYVEAPGLRKFAQVFHDFEIIPILFIRHPATFSTSLYQTMIQYGHIATSDISKKKKYWEWLANIDFVSIINRWAAISHNKKVIAVDYDLTNGRSREVFLECVGLPVQLPGIGRIENVYKSEPAAITFVRQELLLSGTDPKVIEDLTKQLSKAPMTEPQTLIPEEPLRQINASYLVQCQKIRSSSHVRLVQDLAFTPPEAAKSPVYIGTMSGVVFAIGRALATMKN